jgi:hypothetical protein
MFTLRLRGAKGLVAKVIASDGEGWEHVSVSFPGRVPTWQEMCQAKDIFWNAEDRVVQYHPPESEYINDHPFVLHLWRPIDQDLPAPPMILVGLGDPARR